MLEKNKNAAAEAEGKNNEIKEDFMEIKHMSAYGTQGGPTVSKTNDKIFRKIKISSVCPGSSVAVIISCLPEKSDKQIQSTV